MIKSTIVGAGGEELASVNKEGTLNVVVHPHPPIGETLTAQPFRQFFTDNGITSGSNDMRVNGGAAATDFYIGANENYDIYIKSISLAIGDGGSPALNKFGNLSELTNGVSWHLFSNELGLYELHEGVKTNLEFVRLGADTAGIGTGTDAFLADVSGGGTEKSYLPTINIAESFGLLYGLRLRKGSNDKLIFTINDNLTALTTFNAIGYGLRL
jgi:hypothetical protein